MMVLFHKTECGNKGNKLKSWLLLLSIFPLDLHRFSLRGCHVMNERLKTEDSRDELINYRSGSYCTSHVMNEQLEKSKDSKQVN